VLELGTVLAHQGGWDEALMFLVPVGLFVLLFRAASARAHHAEAHGDGPTPR
jgi:predicted MFS family arabinose efflux permease